MTNTAALAPVVVPVEDVETAEVSEDAADLRQVRELVRRCDRVETYRVRSDLTVDDMRMQEDPKLRNRLFDREWPITGRGATRDRAFAQRLGAFLTNPKNFIDRPPGQGVKACAFMPGVGFKLRAGASDYVNRTICFSCAQLDATSSIGVVPLPSIDFDPGYAELLKLAKEAFPDDAEIQAIVWPR